MIYIINPLLDVFKLSMFTVFMGIFLDTTVSINSTKIILKKNPDLYLQGILANYLNLLILSPIYYIAAYNLLLDINSNFSIYKYTGLLTIQSI